MKKFAAIALPIWIVFCTYYYVCCIKKHCCSGDCDDNTEMVRNGSSAIALPGFQMEYANPSLYSITNRDTIVADSSANLVFDSLSSYLQSSKTQIQITGYYSKEESKNSSEDLGELRAEKIKSILVEKGADPNFMITNSEMNKGLNIKDSIIYSPFLITPQAEDQDDQGYLEDHQSVEIYFPSGSSEAEMSQPIEDFISHAKNYLAEHPDAKIICIGHTDNTGDDATNNYLGLQRAQKAAQMLEQNGISKNQIETESAGSSSPIADNSTQEGKAKNRRAELKIKI